MTEIDRWGQPVERVAPDRPPPGPLMTGREVTDVLKLVVAYDNREVTQAVVAAWLLAAQDARWTPEEAATAVRQHYAVSTEWIMPGTVSGLIRLNRQDRAMRAEAERARIADVTAAARVRDLCAEFGLTHFSISDDTREHPRGLHVDCPSCKARRGNACAHPTRRVIAGFVHPTRLEAEGTYIASHRQ